MAGLVTIKDVARVAEVSLGTVSNVFNNHPSVTEKTRQHVLQVAAELGYSGPNGQNAGTRNTNRAVREVGFLVCDANLDNRPATTNPFWSHILYGVEAEARRHNLKITYRTLDIVHNTSAQLFAEIQEMRLGGILLIGTPDEELISSLLTTKIPLVLVDNQVPQLSVDAVLSDNYEGAKEVVNYIINQGHRSVAFIGGPTLDAPRPINKIYTIERRAAGYRTAMLDAGLPVDYDLYESSNLETDGGYQACKRLLGRKVKFSAIFCANDATAIGAVKALREANLRVPDDISLVGFDDLDIAEYLSPSLTTVRVFKEAMGITAIRALIIRSNDPQAVSVTSTLKVELVVRNSVVPPKPKESKNSNEDK